MSQMNNEQQRDVLDVNSHSDHLSPLSNRFLVAHSSPVHETTNELVPTRHPDDSFQSSSSNSKSSSSAHSHTSRLHYLMMQHQSAVNSPLAYSRCTSLGSLSSFDIRSSCNDSYTSECSSIKPSGLISPSDIPDSPPCEPEILEEAEEEEEQEHQQRTKPINRTLTMNTTSSLGRTTMMGETVIEKTFVLHQQEIRTTNQIDEDQEIDDDEHLDEVIVYTYDASEMNKISYNNNEILFDDDSYRVFNSQTDEHNSSIDDNSQSQASFNVPSHENLSVITEESSFIEVEEMHSNDENNSIKILYDLIKKPHWTKNTSFSSDPSSLSLNSFNGNSSDDEDEYDQEKGQQLIQRLIEETLARRSLRTDYLRTAACSTHCPSNTPLTTDTRSITSSSSSSSSSTSSVSAKSCTCANKYLSNSSQPQRSQSSPARPTSTRSEDTKRQINRQKENIIHHTRTSYLRLRQAQQNKRLNNPDKRI